MNNPQLLMLQRLRNDFQFYAKHCLKIVDKQTGQLVPFVFNRAQRYIHEIVEKQKRETGKVRVVIIKGRQQGCLDPNTKVLTAEPKWVKIKDLTPGQQIVACDDQLQNSARKMRTAVVEKVWHTYKTAYRITLDDGRKVVCSGDHRWLSRKSRVDPRWRAVIGSANDGRDSLRVGTLVRTVTSGGEVPEFEDAWFGGMIDGEGSFDHRRRTGADLSISQVDGPVLERMLAHVKQRDYGGCVVNDGGPRRSKHGQRPVRAISIGSMYSLFRLFSLSQPTRFKNISWWEGKRMPDGGWRRIVSIEDIGKRKLVDIQTSTGTFIAEGIVSHNCSTYVEGRFFHDATLFPGTSVFILAHIADSTNHLFGMAKKFYENAPPPILPTIDKMNERRLEFKGINSSYGVGTAGSASIGRGLTIRRFHGSEVAYWERSEEIASGALQAVPKSQDTEIFIESTANGPGDWFHNKVLSGLETGGEGEFITIFVPWYWQPEYARPTPPDFMMTDGEMELARLFKLTPEQLYWRRTVTYDDFGGDERRFMREYPNTVDEAFTASGESLIPASDVVTARGVKISDPMAPLIIGCDPARSGDRTVITFRQGRRILEFKKYSTMDEMTLAGILATEIDKRRVVKCFVDTGCGYGTVDRLRELGYGAIVIPVHFGQAAMQQDIFLNKRAEMAEAMRLWFAEGGVSIPDSDEFQTDILSVPPLEKSGSRGKLALTTQEIIRKKFGKSPDIADSVMLTFAFPVAAQASTRRVTRAPLDVRRPGSPLATVRDFNNPKTINTKTKLF